MTSRRALGILIVGSAILRIIWAASLGPGNDEAYHYLFTVHRDWSYFDHPPMLAVIESLGIAAAGGVVTTLTLRIGFIALFAGSTWLMARLTSRYYGEKAGLLAAFALNLSAYHTVAAGAFALPDGPLLFFWLLTLDRLTLAINASGRKTTWPWVAVGLAWGCAMLSKYHAIFLPAGTLLYLFMDPGARRWLRNPGPYVSVAVGLAIFSPVIGWNATHHWASFSFQGGRALGGAHLRFDTLIAAIFLPALYLFPWIWIRLIDIILKRGRRFFEAETSAIDRFLLCQSVLPLGTFLAVACTRPVLPHWTLVGFIPIFPMLGQAWERALVANPIAFRRRAVFLTATPILISGLIIFQARSGFFQEGRPGGVGLVKAAHDPTSDMVGWDTVANELRSRGLLNDPRTFIFTSSWYQSGQLAFAARDFKIPVLCYHAWDARSFAFWSEPKDWVGRDGILVGLNDLADDPYRYSRWFERIEPLGGFEVRRSGGALRKVKLYRCVRQKRPFPFDDLGRTIHPIKIAETRVAVEASGHGSEANR